MDSMAPSSVDTAVDAPASRRELGSAVTGSYALATNPGLHVSMESSPAPGSPDRDAHRLRAAVARVPGMGDQPFVSSVLPGGLTNRNYRVSAADGRLMVVRLSSPQSSVLTIARDDEYVNARAAATAGVAPQVLAYVPEFSALVIEWIEGRTFGAKSLDDSSALRQVAATCRALHAGPRFATDFDMFALTRRYLDLTLARGYRIPPDYLTLLPQLTAIEVAMAAQAEPTVPCHNDLLPANIMADATQMWFIDYEYAGNGDPCFELGNLCSEAHLGTHRLEELVAAYYGTPAGTRLSAKVARARLHALMSNYGWTLWACIQAATSELDFDFWGWGMEKYERAVAEFRGPELSRLISDVQHP
jgi:thiamine kinase-like enzyme